MDKRTDLENFKPTIINIIHPHDNVEGLFAQ